MDIEMKHGNEYIILTHRNRWEIGMFYYNLMSIITDSDQYPIPDDFRAIKKIIPLELAIQAPELQKQVEKLQEEIWSKDEFIALQGKDIRELMNENKMLKKEL